MHIWVHHDGVLLFVRDNQGVVGVKNLRHQALPAPVFGHLHGEVQGTRVAGVKSAKFRGKNGIKNNLSLKKTKLVFRKLDKLKKFCNYSQYWLIDWLVEYYTQY